MNFEDTYSRMDNDELLRLTSEWTTLTEPAQVALASEMEKRKLGNQFEAERQTALEKPNSPSRNRFRTWLVIAIAVGAITGFLKHAENNPIAAASELYNGGDFTMVVPAGSTSVKVKYSAQPLDGQQMVQHAYSFSNSTVSYRIQSDDYSSHTEGAPEEDLRSTVSQVFNPGYSASFSNSHLGSLFASATEAEGTTVHGKTVFMKMRMAFSDDRKRMWLAIVTAPDRQSFLAAQGDAFMDSIQIKSR